MLLGVQWDQGESSLRAASAVVPESACLFGLAGESAAWPSKETSSFFSPSSDCEQEALLQSMHIRSQAVEGIPVDAPMPAVVQEEEIDVSAFLVSNPEVQLPNASWTAGPQMAGRGGGASASWMVPGSIGTCNSGGSSVGVASSIGGMMKPSSPVPPLVPPSTQGAGASSTNLNGFAQPSSSSVLSPRAPNLQGPLLPVKQEVMEYVDTTARRHPPDIISLVDDDEDELHLDAIFGSWGSSKSSWPRSSSGSPCCFAPGSWGSSIRRPSFASSSWGGGSSSSSPSCVGSMPCFDQRMSIDIYGSSSMQEQSVRGKMASVSDLPPLPKSCVRASCSNGGAGLVFTDPEMAIIAKEKKLQELLRTDPKKVKR